MYPSEQRLSVSEPTVKGGGGRYIDQGGAIFSLCPNKPDYKAVMCLPFDSKGVASHGYERDMGVDLLRAG